MNLRKALRLDRSAGVVIVGAGGKTSAMFRLARELTPPVIVTTTTHIGVWQTREGDRWAQGLADLGSNPGSLGSPASRSAVTRVGAKRRPTEVSTPRSWGHTLAIEEWRLQSASHGADAGPKP